MSWNESLKDSLQHAAPFVLWVILLLATSILVAVIREPFSRVLRDARDQLKALRSRLLIRSAIRLGRKSHRFWLARQHEPTRTVAGSLERLARALPLVGKKSLAQLTALEADLRNQLGTLEALGLRPPGPRTSPTDAAPTTAAPRGSWWKLLLLTGIAFLTGAANSFLLNQFFQGVITSDALFPSAFPDFQVSHVFAVLIFMMEVAIGFALHHFAQEHDDESVARRLLSQAPWLVLVGLVWLEGWAYALLSYQIDIPERLNLSANSGLYTFARYFLALFGAGLTLLLASLGYLLGKETEKLHSGREARRQERIQKRYGWLISGGADQVERTVRALSRLRTAAQGFHLDLVHQFKREVDATSSSENLQAAVHDALRGILDLGPARRPVRTRAQALADMSLFTAALGLVVLVSWVSVDYVAAFVRSVQGNRPSANLFALVSGVVLTGFALSSGYIAGHAWSGTRSGSGTPLLPSSSSGQRLLWVLAALFLLAAGAALVTVAVANQTLGPSTALNVLFGLLHAGILVILGAGIDTAMMSTLHLLRLAGLHLTRFLVSLGAAGLWVVGAVLAVLDWTARLVAVFGQLVVRPRPAVRVGVADISRGAIVPRELRSPARRFTDKVYAPVARGKHG
jgi:hypothetical protein